MSRATRVTHFLEPGAYSKEDRTISSQRGRTFRPQRMKSASQPGPHRCGASFIVLSAPPRLFVNHCAPLQSPRFTRLPVANMHPGGRPRNRQVRTQFTDLTPASSSLPVCLTSCLFPTQKESRLGSLFSHYFHLIIVGAFHFFVFPKAESGFYVSFECQNGIRILGGVVLLVWASYQRKVGRPTHRGPEV